MDPNDTQPVLGPPPEMVLSTSASAAPNPEQDSQETSGNSNCESDSQSIPSRDEAPLVFSPRLVRAMNVFVRPMMEAALNQVFGDNDDDDDDTNQEGQRMMVTDENLTTMLSSMLIFGPPRINDPSEEHEANEGTSSLNGEEESSEPGSGDADAFADGSGSSPERGVGERFSDGDSPGSRNEGQDQLGPPRINDPSEEHESTEGTSSLNGVSFEPESGNADAFADGGNSPESIVGESPEVTANSQQPLSSQLESGDFEAAVEGDSHDSVNQAQDETSADAKWHEMFEKLVAHKAQTGHCFVMDWEDPELARWACEQRKRYRYLLRAAPTKVERLDDIGFVWDESWILRLKELIAYKQEHGDCNVPQRFRENPQLGVWVTTQRSGHTCMKKGLPPRGMTEGKAAILDGTGFVWNIRASWNERFDELEQFKKEKGHCNVPQTHHPKLKSYVDTMKRKLRDVAEGKRTNLTDAQINKLREIGLSAVKQKRSASEHVASSEPSNTQQTEPRPKRYKTRAGNAHNGRL